MGKKSRRNRPERNNNPKNEGAANQASGSGTLPQHLQIATERGASNRPDSLRAATETTRANIPDDTKFAVYNDDGTVKNTYGLSDLSNVFSDSNNQVVFALSKGKNELYFPINSEDNPVLTINAILSATEDKMPNHLGDISDQKMSSVFGGIGLMKKIVKNEFEVNQLAASSKVMKHEVENIGTFKSKGLTTSDEMEKILISGVETTLNSLGHGEKASKYRSEQNNKQREFG
jgi:hypothetical protein